MLDGSELDRLVEKHRPDLVVPEIEAIRTERLYDYERRGTGVVPSARAADFTMDRRAIRDLAARETRPAHRALPLRRHLRRTEGRRARVGATRRDQAAHVLVGQRPVGRSHRGRLGAGLGLRRERRKGGRGRRDRRGLRPVRVGDHPAHRDPAGRSHPLLPAHRARPGARRLPGVRGSPAPSPRCISRRHDGWRASSPRASAGAGLWGVEFFLAEDGVVFSELSPRPHDTGMVTLAGTQSLSEFDLHARAILGLPIPAIEPLRAGRERGRTRRGRGGPVVHRRRGGSARREHRRADLRQARRPPLPPHGRRPRERPARRGHRRPARAGEGRCEEDSSRDHQGSAHLDP